jgi:hypothetical protein
LQYLRCTCNFLCTSLTAPHYRTAQVYMQRLIGKVLDEEELLEQIEREEDLATLGSAGECLVRAVSMCCGALHCLLFQLEHGAV